LVGRRPRIEPAVGNPAVAMLEEARQDGESPTLIAVGNRGLGLAKRLRLGSGSTKVLRAAKVPVLVCPRETRATEQRV
jgi:nucleotide-binding universal stress UspA family protein